MMASLSDNTMKQYDVCLKKWWSFCQEKLINYYEASVPSVIYFFTQIFNNGSKYGTLNSYRSALSLILGPNMSKDDRILRFFKGVFRLRPPRPKYNVTWDTNRVLDFLRSKYPNEQLSLVEISKKCATLLALTTAHRVQTLSKISMENISMMSSKIIIKIPDLIKTSRVGSQQPLLTLPFFNESPEICPANTLVFYINKTKDLRKSGILFINPKKPHNSVSPQTLSRWIKCTLSDSGLDVSMFSAHSTRHAATSRAHALGVSIDEIRRTAGWSGSSETFARFYNRTITDYDASSLARSIINQ